MTTIIKGISVVRIYQTRKSLLVWLDKLILLSFGPSRKRKPLVISVGDPKEALVPATADDLHSMTPPDDWQISYADVGACVTIDMLRRGVIGLNLWANDTDIIHAFDIYTVPNAELYIDERLVDSDD